MRLFKPNIPRLLKKKDVPGLIEALSDPDLNVRSEAASALGEIGDAQAVDALVAALRQGPCKVAADALAKIGVPSVGPLIAALNDKRDNVRDAVTVALVKIGTPVVQPLRFELLGRFSGYNGQAGGQAAARALGEIGGAQAIDALVAVLNHGYVHQAAIDALVRIGTPAIGPLIAALATLKDNYAREGAANALAKIGLPAVEPLVAALQDKNARQAAAHALYKLGWEPCTGETAEIRAVYWIATREWQKCIEIGAPALAPLVEALEDHREDVRQSIVSALDQLGWQPGIDEASAIYYIAKKQWHKCVEIGAPAVEPLIAVLEGNDKLAPRDAARSLGLIGDIRAVQPLIKTLDKYGHDHGLQSFPFETAHIREAVVVALGRIGDAQAVEPLINSLQDDWFGVRHDATVALGIIGDRRATEPLIHTLQKDKNWRVGLISYLVLQQTQDVVLADLDVQQLVKSLADEIRSLYSKTEPVGGRLVPASPDDDERPDYVDSDGDWWRWDPPPDTKPNPDLAGIRRLISTIPDELRERVSALSGEAKKLF